MGRLVEAMSSTPKAAAGGESKLERIAKYVPAEILSFYAMWVEATALLNLNNNATVSMVAIGCVIGLVATPIYFWKFFPTEPKTVRQAHMMVSSVAFLAYSYSISSVAIPDFVNPAICLLLTAVATLLSAFIRPRTE